ncbi:cytochrome P450 [Pilatotrama ljubarskyi]|nr:cytochrome P450 [Pilatotrama ljubarskyi]
MASYSFLPFDFAWKALIGSVLVLGVAVAWGVTSALLQNRKSPLWIAPGPPSANWLLGNLKQLDDSENDVILDQWAATYGKVVRLNAFFDSPLMFITDTKALNHIFSRSAEYVRPEYIRRDLAKLLCEGLLCTEGERHKQQRRVMNPAFGPAQIREMTHVFFEKALELRNLWAAQLESGQQLARINALPGLNAATLDIIGVAAFNHDFEALNPEKKHSELAETMERVFSMPNRKPILLLLKNLSPYLNYLTDPNMPLVDHAVSLMRRAGSQFIAERKAEILREMSEEKRLGIGRSSVQSKDMLSLLVKANIASDSPESQPLSDEDVLAQVPTFIVTGHETTGDAMAWCLYALTQAPSVQSKLRDELSKVQTDSPSMDELMALPYLDMVIRETLRLHPPVISTIRVATRADVIPLSAPFTGRDGSQYHSLEVPKGTKFVISILALHRSKELWGDDALEFKPERWENPPEAVSDIPGAWGHLLTFGGGPRACIGYRFAVVEMKALVFTLIRAFEMELAVQPEEICTLPGIVLRPRLKRAPEAGSQMPLIIQRCDRL